MAVLVAMIEKLVDAVMRNLPKTNSARCYTREFVQQRIGMMFPVFETPDHPPYSLMIEQAIAKLNEEGGSSEESISKCISLAYNCLPWAHASLLSHHLRKLRDLGEIIYTCDDRYMLPFDNGKGSVPPLKMKEKFKKARGRKRGIHGQNKKLKRDTSMGSQNFEAEHKMKQGGPEIKDFLDQGETSQVEMRINPQDLELSTKENIRVEGNELGSLSQCPQYQSPGEANQAAEKINDEPMVEQEQGSDEHHTAVEQMPMEQEFHLADHDESHEQSTQQHDVILAQQDQVEAQTVSIEDIEQSRRADSESCSRIMKLPQQSEADDFSVRCDSTENQNKVIEGQSEKSQLLEMLCQQILMRQNEIGELVGRLKQLTEAPENVVLPCEKFVKVLRRNREIELVLLEKLNTSPESSNSLVNQSLHQNKAGVPSKDLPKIGDGTAGVRFPQRRCQPQDNFIQAMRTASCAASAPPLYLNPCHRHPDDASKDSGDLSSGQLKQPELSNQRTQSHEQCILQQHSGDKLCGSSLSCVVALPVPERWENLLKQQLQDGSVKDSSFCEERMEEYPAVFIEHKDLNHDHSESEPSDKLLELPIPEGAAELLRMESQKMETEWMTKSRVGFFSAEQSYSARQTREQPPQNEIERNNTIPIAMKPGSPASLTSTYLSSTKKRYKSDINLKYLEKLRSQNLSTDPIPTNPFSGEAKDSPPLAIPVSPGMELQHPLPKRKVDARNSEEGRLS